MSQLLDVPETEIGVTTERMRNEQHVSRGWRNKVAISDQGCFISFIVVVIWCTGIVSALSRIAFYLHLYCIALHCIALYCVILHIVLHFTTLVIHRIVYHRFWQSLLNDVLRTRNLIFFT